MPKVGNRQSVSHRLVGNKTMGIIKKKRDYKLFGLQMTLYFDINFNG